MGGGGTGGRPHLPLTLRRAEVCRSGRSGGERRVLGRDAPERSRSLGCSHRPRRRGSRHRRNPRGGPRLALRRDGHLRHHRGARKDERATFLSQARRGRETQTPIDGAMWCDAMMMVVKS